MVESTRTHSPCGVRSPFTVHLLLQGLQRNIALPVLGIPLLGWQSTARPASALGYRRTSVRRKLAEGEICAGVCDISAQWPGPADAVVAPWDISPNSRVR